MKLYVNLLSPNVRRVRLTAALLGLRLDETALDFTKGEQKTPQYLALNANGAVPTLVDGDFVLKESRAIIPYLDSIKPESGLLPTDGRARADVTRWQFWDASHFSAQYKEDFVECSRITTRSIRPLAPLAAADLGR